MMLGPSRSMAVPDLVGLSPVVVKFVEVCIFCSLVGSCSHWDSLDVLGDGSCILLWELAAALVVQIVVEVAILNHGIVKVVEDLDIKIGFATWLGGAPLRLCC